jgi:hypothetical protein
MRGLGSTPEPQSPCQTRTGAPAPPGRTAGLARPPCVDKESDLRGRDSHSARKCGGASGSPPRISFQSDRSACYLTTCASAASEKLSACTISSFHCGHRDLPPEWSSFGSACRLHAHVRQLACSGTACLTHQGPRSAGRPQGTTRGAGARSHLSLTVWSPTPTPSAPLHGTLGAVRSPTIRIISTLLPASLPNDPRISCKRQAFRPHNHFVPLTLIGACRPNGAPSGALVGCMRLLGRWPARCSVQCGEQDLSVLVAKHENEPRNQECTQ